jgi:hypothetical protein
MDLEYERKRLITFQRNLNFKLVILAFIGSFLCIFISILDESFALQYTIHTSDKYLVNFQYPSTWEIVEKTDRFDEYADIRIKDTHSGNGSFYISVNKHADSNDHLDIQSMTENSLDVSTRYDSSAESQVIENPSYLEIDGHPTGTFVYTLKYKLEEPEVRYAAQNWIVLLEDRDYAIQFSSTTDVFDSSDYIEARDTFIKSLEFIEK